MRVYLKIRKATFSRAFFFRPQLLSVAALLVFSMVVFPKLLRSMPDVSTRPEYQVQWSDVKHSPAPKWVPEDFLEQVRTEAKLEQHISVLDKRLVSKTAAAFEKHPWVKRVVRVEKAIPASLLVALEYREPVALVELRAGFYPVDADGYLLPPQDFSTADIKRYPIIQNVNSLPEATGKFWGDMRVMAAARLAEQLKPHWKAIDCQAIVLPKQMKAKEDVRNLQMQLLAKNGSQILWGRPPGNGHPGELTSRQKIGRLEKYVADFGSLSDPEQRYEIDLRHWQEIARRSLIGDQRRRF